MSDIEYVLDTSVVVMLNRLIPKDINPGAWEVVEELASDGRLVMPSIAYTELQAGTDECAAWAKAQKGLIVEPSEAEVVVVQAITAAHPDWVTETKNAADPFVIACAEINEAVALTQENFSKPHTADKNLSLRTVALERGVTCMNYVEVARHLGWKFRRT